MKDEVLFMPVIKSAMNAGKLKRLILEAKDHEQS